MRRLLVLVCAVVLLDTAFYAVVAPLLPDLAVELDLSKAEAGVLVGAYAAGTLVAALPTGLLATRVGPRRVLLLGLALLAASSVTFGLVRVLIVLDVARFVQGIGGACSWAGAMAWLLSVAPASRRGTLIGTAMGAAIAGSLLGPVLGVVADVLGQAPTFVSVGAVAGVLALLALREPAPPPQRGQTLTDVRRALDSGTVRLAAWLVALPAVTSATLGVLVPLRLAEMGAASVLIAAAFLVAAAGESAISPLVGWLSDRHGRLLPVSVGLLLTAVLVATVSLPRSAFGVAALFVACVMAIGTFWAPAIALLSDSSEAAGLEQGPALGLVNLAWAAGAACGAAGSGLLASRTTDVVPLVLLAAACAATLAALRLRRVTGVPATPE